MIIQGYMRSYGKGKLIQYRGFKNESKNEQKVLFKKINLKFKL